jgi:hypothetical protein
MLALAHGQHVDAGRERGERAGQLRGRLDVLPARQIAMWTLARKVQRPFLKRASKLRRAAVLFPSPAAARVPGRNQSQKFPATLSTTRAAPGSRQSFASPGS